MRTDQQWLDELADAQDGARQQQAHHDLATYLYTIAYNYLCRRQFTLPGLAAFASDELAAMAQDFVQEVLIKLSSDDFALLKTYRGDGKFTSWCARMVCNVAAGELRRPYWTRRREEDEEFAAPSQESPVQLAEIALLRAALDRCIERLPERQRLAFQASIIEEQAAKAVAERLATKEDAVYQLVYRARTSLRHCLEQAGINPLDFIETTRH
jgi:RNA polymerase sigma factor (sigma-70 family)